MKFALLCLVRACMVAALLLPLPPSLARPGTAAPAVSSPSPLFFMENAGQFAGDVRFQAWGSGPIVWLAEDAIWLTLFEGDRSESGTEGDRRSLLSSLPSGARGASVKLTFPGANSHPRLEPFQRLATRVSFFKGNKQEEWRAGAPAWGGVRYADLYPGIDLELTAEQGRLVPRLVAQPGAGLGAVRLRLEGAEAVSVKGGALELHTAAGSVRWPLLRAPGSAAEPLVRSRGGQAFEVVAPVVPEEREPAGAAAVTDDPSDLLYGSFLGGSSGDWGQRIALDGTGAVYVVGVTQSGDLPTTDDAFDPEFSGEHDAFVIKFGPDGSTLEYATFLGGDRGDPAHGLAVDASGAAYIAGHTESDDFPTTEGAFQTDSPAGGDAFVVKLSATGSTLEYATFIGGSNTYEGALDIALGAGGTVYVVGVTGSGDFPVTEGAYDTVCGSDGLCDLDDSDPPVPAGDTFVAKLNASGSDLEFATFLGGSGAEWSTAIAADESGAAFVTGSTTSSDFPTTLGAVDRDYGGDPSDGFVVKVSPDGAELSYSTYLGGSAGDSAEGIALDGSGSAYVAGYTYSPDLPATAGAFDTALGTGDIGYGDAFVAKLNAAGSTLRYLAFLGGSADDYGESIVVDEGGTAFVTGKTDSSDFPTTSGAFDTTYNDAAGNQYGDAFVARLDAAGAGLEYSTFLGGSGSDWAYAIAVRSGVAYVSGTTSSPDFPTTPGAYDSDYNGDPVDAFVVKLRVEPPVYFYRYLPLVLRNG